MNSLDEWLCRFYTKLLNLYPSGFRSTFAEEMEAVFGEALAEAFKRGALAIIRVCLRELVDLPGNVLREHWREQVVEEAAMFTALAMGEVGGKGQVDVKGQGSQQVGWGQAGLAGLPHLMIAFIAFVPGVLFAYEILPRDFPGRKVFDIASPLLLAAVTVWIVVLARRQGWPRWSASWLVYALMLGLGAVLAPMGQLKSRFAEALINLVIFTLLPLAIAIFYYYVAKRDRIKVSLLTLPFMEGTWFVVLEFVSNRVESLLSLGSWLVLALAAAAIVRLGNWKVGVWLAIGTSLLVGLGSAYAHFYHYEGQFFSGQLPLTLADLGDFLLPTLVGSTTVVLGPLLLVSVRKLGRQGVYLDALAYNMVFCGCLLIMGGNLAAFWLGMDGRLLTYRYLLGSIFVYMMLLGLLLAGVGSLLLCVSAWISRVTQDRLTLLLVLVLPISLPWVFQLMFGALGMPMPMLEDLMSIRILVYGGAVLWAVLAYWFIRRLDVKTPAFNRLRQTE